MKWSIKQIEELKGLPLQFSEDVNIKSSLLERESEIIDVSDVKINGTLLYDNHSIIAMFEMNVTLTLPSSRTLTPVEVPLDIHVFERYVESDYLAVYARENQNEVIIPLGNHHIELKESIIDNILLNLPIQVLSEDEKQNIADLPKGNGWTLYTEDAYNKQKEKEAKETVDPRLAGLKALLNQEDKS
ncbi:MULTISPECIES: DUF177 domain-containing protein [unclassified Granulicatella]|uniref:YceD family protein n=1 Tax=unclassified Granulicatella TaxID=2630493 RepID=UPI0010735E90|nr:MULTISPECIES: YceD family protein [unclassified Granulicatella]MBF0780886.1 DUF177 domain-containing protein [Granulicatella sp. 19428wC4_WM01]TFU93237.1 DUF177 domain-containing protein [Granulicatella sp. WM01]